MSFNFGNISSRQGRSQQADLPLDVIAGVGNNLTNRYYTNRQAASKLKEQVLNLPDSNSEGNKKIIEKLSKEVKDSFAQYSKEDTWFDADKAVYDTMDKITSSQEVKDLYKYNAQYAKVDEDIEKSGASELDKQTRRAMNQTINKGIRGDMGESLSYQGRSLSGDLDITKYYKKYDDLVKGFEADMESYASNPSTFAMDTASDGFQQYVMKYGTTKVTSVDKAEISNYIRSLVENDSKFKAELSDIAELELFRSTGRTSPTKEDVSAALDRKAGSSQTIQYAFVYSSPKFLEETKNMNDGEKLKYANKIMSNKEVRNRYYMEGKESQLSTPNTNYDQLYKGIYLSNAIDGLDNIASKYAYRKVDTDVKYLMDPLSGKRYEDYLKNMGTHSLVSTFGNVSTEGIGTYMDLRDKYTSDINQLKGILASKDLSEEVRSDKTKLLQDLESRKRTNDYIIDNYKNNLNMTESDIIDSSSGNNIWNIKQILANPGFVSGEPNVSVNRAEFLKNASKLKGKESKVYEILKNTNGGTIEDTRKALEKEGMTIDDVHIEILKKSINRAYKENMHSILKDRNMDAVSIPLMTIGNIGVNQPTYDKAMSELGKQWSLGVGDFEIISSSDNDLLKDRTNMGRQKTWVHPTKKVGGSFPIEIQLATMANDSPQNTGQLLLNIIETDPLTGVKSTHLARYKGNNIIGSQVMNEVLTANAKSVFKPNNPNVFTDTEAAKFAAGVLGGNLPVDHIGTDKIEGLTLSGALSNIKRVFGNEYETIHTNINGIDARIVTTESNGIFHQQLFDNNTNKPISDDITGVTPNTIAQYIGAIQALQTYGVGSPNGKNIAKLFNINLSK